MQVKKKGTGKESRREKVGIDRWRKMRDKKVEKKESEEGNLINREVRERRERNIEGGKEEKHTKKKVEEKKIGNHKIDKGGRQEYKVKNIKAIRNKKRKWSSKDKAEKNGTREKKKQWEHLRMR